MMALMTASTARCSGRVSVVKRSVCRSSTCRNSWQTTAFTCASVRQCSRTNARFTSRRGRCSHVTASVGTVSVNSTQSTFSTARMASGFSSINSR